METWWNEITTYLHDHAVDWLTSAAVGLITIAIGWVLARLAASAVRRAMRRTHAASLAPMTSTLARLTVLVGAVVMGFDQMGFDVTTVLAGAGVLGLAVGFGAQQLVKDCISGFFLVVERVLDEGDWVDLDGKFGQVEDVGLRVTKIRSFDGTVWAIPNGEIKTVGNKCRGWVRAIVEVAVAYEGDAARALEVLQRVGDAWAEENPELLWEGEAPIAQGPLELADSSVNLRLVVKIKHSSEGEVWPLERQLRLRLKAAFDQEGVEIPFPRLVTYHRQEEEAALRVQSAA